LEIHSIKDDSIYNIMCGETNSTRYIRKYICSEKIEAEFAVIEDNYIDRDFCVDYSKYYSSSHTKVSRVCRRIHFFKKPQTGDLQGLFASSKGTAILQELYCGFTVIDGISKDKNGCLKGHVGRTALRTYCKDKDGCGKRNGKSFFHAYPQKVSLFGHELIINSLPFTTKDEDVGMCATAALWVAQFPLIERHGGSRFSQYEITDAASKIGLGMSGGRRFPAGLFDEQMIGYLYERGYEVECLKAEETQAEYIRKAIKTFVDAKVPVIASLSLHREDDVRSDGHAVVISGYSLGDDGELNGVYVHDDNIGPYARVKFKNGVNNWEYKEEEYEEYSNIHLDALIVPLYPKIKLPYLMALKEGKLYSKNYLDGAPYEIILIEGKDYKKRILCENYNLYDLKDGSDLTQEVLEMLLPRFVWVVRCNYKGLELDILLDSTSIERRRIVAVAHLKNP